MLSAKSDALNNSLNASNIKPVIISYLKINVSFNIVAYLMAKSILFICTGNSVRSIMGEVIARDMGKGVWESYSGGAAPYGNISPATLKTLSAHAHRTDGLYSKSLKLFKDKEFDYVITVCSKAQKECPVWPGKTKMLHWDLRDPSVFTGSEAEKAAFFEEIYQELTARIADLLGIVSQTK
jgi:protein-tyrosine-phosphatase